MKPPSGFFLCRKNGHLLGRVAEQAYLPAQAGAQSPMFYVYIIKSEDYNWYYVGMSSDVDKRLKEHNGGKTRSTKNRRPFKLVFKKAFGSRKEARDFERYLKVKSNKEKLLRDLSCI